MNEEISIVLVTNNAYAALTAVACESLLDNARESRRINFYIIFDSLRKSFAERLHEGIRRKGGSLTYLPIDNVVKTNQMYRNLSPHYYRLLAPSILPHEVERFIYLDSDILVRGDISGLWGHNLQQNTIGMVQDYIKTVKEAISNYQVLNMNGDQKYFNSGVLLVDRTCWLKDNVSDRILECTRRNRAYLDAMGMYHQYDQYGLNVVLHNQCLELDYTWNYGSLDPYQNVKIVHYIGNGKPWDRGCTKTYRSEFFAYLGVSGWKTSELPIHRPEEILRG
jgi:lipopolysaccharide biosynthesis glycosyltransferase